MVHIMKKNVTSALYILLGLFAFCSELQAAGECEKLKPVSGQEIDQIPDQNGNPQIRFMVKAIESFSFKDREEAREAQEDARMMAKKKFVEWMKSEVSFEKSIDKFSKKRTELSGDQKKVFKTKMKTVSSSVREKGEAYITGAVFSGQAIDMDNMESCVTMVWTPALSKIATDVSVNMSKDAGKQMQARNTAKQAAASPTSGQASNRRPATSKTDDNTPGVKIVTIEVKAEGTDIQDATNTGLKRAVSMVFGQQLQASSKYSKAHAKLDVFSNLFGSGSKNSLAVKAGFRSDNIRTSTSGLIDSYEILQDQQRENSYFVLLRVKLPKYQTSIDPNKSRVIVLAPKFKRSEVDGALADEFKDQMIELLNGSNKLTVLDRDSLREQANELKLIMAGNSPIKELARVGQTAGADIMVISEFSSLSGKRSDKKLGARTISRIVYNGKFTIKFIDVATTNIILTKNVSIKKRRFKSNSASAKLSRYVIGKVRPTLSKKFGVATSSRPAVKKKGPEKLKSTLFEETEKRVKQDW